jgi:hypothetical protein
MRIHQFLCVLFCLVSIQLNAQQQEPNLSPYKYAIVDNRYDFQREDNSYKINDYVMFLFEKKGFKVIFDNGVIPEELVNNPCLGLKVDLEDSSGSFSFKMRFKLYDCRNELIFEGQEARSKVKSFERGYPDVIRKAFVSVDDLDYVYEPDRVFELESPTTSKVLAETAVVSVATNSSGLEGIYKRDGLALTIEEIDGAYTASLSGRPETAQIFSTSDKNIYSLIWEGDPKPYLLKQMDEGVSLDSPYGLLVFKREN